MTLAKFLRTGAAALGALAVATQANAADIYTGGGGLKDVPVAPPPLWTGFYAGVHLGAAWTDYSSNRNMFWDNCASGVWCDPASGNYTSSGTPFGKDLDQTSAFGGGQFGYNWMPYGWTSVVLGIEVDIDGVAGNNEKTFFPNTYDNIDLTNGNPTLTGINAVRIKTEGGFAGDVTGRLGYTWGPALLYAKGGFAWLESKLSVQATSYDVINGPVQNYAPTSANWSNDTTLTGYTVGAGIEWLLNPNWSVKIEYLHFDFSGSNNNWSPTFYYDGASPTNNNTWRMNNDLTIDTVKLGVNYHLTAYQAPLK